MRRRVAILLSVLAVGVALFLTAPATGASTSNPMKVLGVKTKADIAAVQRTGARIDYYEHGVLYIEARSDQADAIRKLGLKIADVGILAAPVDPAYHDHAETLAEVNRIVAAHPLLASRVVIGQSHQGKDIVAVKISDNVGTDEDEPELLFTANIHAREHLTVEMALFLADLLTSKYGVDAEVTKMVNTREVWIIPMVNPDGAEFDIATGNYVMWRKNRQPNSGSSHVGTDLNRNWGYKWGCCGGSSPYKSSDTYRGPSAFSAPETKAVRDFVLGRKVGGVQQIKMSIDIHTFSELVLWPFGYTYNTVVANMTADQYDTHRTIGTEMALANGYWPGQASGLYITDGDINDWMWGDQRIFSYTFEMYPKDWNPEAFYPPSSVIVAETTRNRDALLRFSSYADCPYRSIGKESTYCAATNDYVLTATPAATTVAQGSSATAALSAVKTTGANQSVFLTATGLPPGAIAGFSSGTILTDGASHTMTIHTAANTTPGVYPVLITGSGSDGVIRTVRQTVTVTGRAECAGTNGTDVSVPDNGNAHSPITIAGCGGNGVAAGRVDLKIAHNNVGDLAVILTSPSGSQHLLHDRAGGGYNNIERSYTVNLSAESVDGTWKLEVFDVSTGVSGKIDTWTLTLK